MEVVFLKELDKLLDQALNKRKIEKDKERTTLEVINELDKIIETVKEEKQHLKYCPICRRMFVCKKSVDSHMQQVHCIFTCGSCGFKAKSRYFLKKHEREVHFKSDQNDDTV